MSQSSSGSAQIRINVVDKTDVDANSVYAELEEYLSRGFLISPAFISNISFVFKTLTGPEIQYVQMIRPRNLAEAEASAHFRAAFIAHSIFIIDGVNALVDRNQNISKLIKIVKKISPVLQDKIMENLKILNEKAAKLNVLVETYAHEPRSRFRWIQVKDFRLNDPSLTGIYGTEGIPINTVQFAWVAMNHILDKRDDMEAAWQNAKFIGGCFAGKGIRQIEERDKNRKDLEKKEIEDKRMDALRKYISAGGSKEDVTEQIMLPDGRKAEVVSRFKAETAEELAEMLSKALNDEKDAHDLAVESHLKKLNDRSDEIRQSSSEVFSIVNTSGIPEVEDWTSGAQALNRMNRIREAILRQRIAREPTEPPEE